MTQRQAKVDVSALVRAARQREGDSLDRLLELYRNYLRLLAKTWIDGFARGKADPSDLVQETLFRAYKAFPAFRGKREEELVGWLRQIMARQLTDLARRLRAGRRDVARELPLEQLLQDRLQGMAAATISSPSHAAQRRELGVVLADALAQLSPPRREVIVLRNLEELDWPEVARRMGRNESAVRKLWARALWARALLALRPLIEEST